MDKILEANCCSYLCTHEELIKIAEDKLNREIRISEIVNYYHILGNETRIKIIAILDGLELCVCDIAKAINLSIPATSQQLKILRNNKFLNQRKDGKTVYYSLKKEHSFTKIKDISLK
ncbi:ArsR/SmtB family transcription factor [Helicovermis profundi]|uniref:Metalloregulator ArsR/SmtB family transcription factor n=1 Tax=Helicovermis profundi TaxID=3065157 RepID=A0AAU9EXK5_9FIRM|nr:metalloregulator ArsR/SmtB family transcription factor [Clostridia bacterium S502]